MAITSLSVTGSFTYVYMLRQLFKRKQHQSCPCLVLAHLHKHSQLRQTYPQESFFFLAINKLAHRLGHCISPLEHLPTNQGHYCLRLMLNPSGGAEEHSVVKAYFGHGFCSVSSLVLWGSIKDACAWCHGLCLVDCALTLVGLGQGLRG